MDSVWRATTPQSTRWGRTWRWRTACGNRTRTSGMRASRCRVSLPDVPAAIVEEDDEEESGPGGAEEREAEPPSQRVRREDLAAGGQPSPEGPQARRGPRASPPTKLSYEERVPRSLPPGWKQVTIRSKYDTTYKPYVGPLDRRAQSIREAWRLHGFQWVVDSGSDAVDSGDMESGYTGSGDEEVQEGDGEEEPEVMPVPQVRSSAAAGSSSDGAMDGAADRY